MCAILVRQNGQEEWCEDPLHGSEVIVGRITHIGGIMYWCHISKSAMIALGVIMCCEISRWSSSLVICDLGCAVVHLVLVVGLKDVAGGQVVMEKLRSQSGT